MSRPPFAYHTSHVEFSSKTIIIPVVSTANVSQLAADLLITSLSLYQVATFNPEYFVPVAGAREEGEEGTTSPLEPLKVFGSSESHLLVIQQRSPVLRSRKLDFVTALLGFLQESGVGSILFLSGVDLSNRTDSQMITPTYQIHPRNSPSLTATPLASLSTLPIPTYASPVLQSPNDAAEDNTIPFIPGGGLTRRILASLPKGWPIPTASLLQFVLEGDNRADARLFAAVTAKVIGCELSEWQQPNSWRAGLFGSAHDQTLYG